MANSDLSGIICASVTPITMQFSIDAGRLAMHCARLLSEGCSFVSTFGTTGEGASFSTNEKIAALQDLRDAGSDMSRQIPSVMTPSSDEAGRMIAEIAALGCRGALVLPPFYYASATEEGIVAFFETALERAGNPDIDILLYNIPQFTRITFTPSLVRKLVARFGAQIVGIKDSTGKLDSGVELAQGFPQLSVFTGDDRVLPNLLPQGGAGMIGGMPNVFSKDLRQLYEAPGADSSNALKANAATRIEAVDGNGALLALKATLAAIYDDAEWSRAMPPLMELAPERAKLVFDAIEATGFAVRPAA
ncbi:dihydrodipicolinate synthase family protein [Devosia sp. XJ19-1]|uniref:Dihydrodipicolinate synthase family protein n=1 Tax=Devosia ureilytica TaxID=2952754 RepID=A0A9Q4ASK3_9HYPH|nr:dihydrodipicolinate synthase family protein [Devosia ureilytica]MCP8888858.1 dihydrodipicolinate synthase family protein [Devosia ureilytica]